MHYYEFEVRTIVRAGTVFVFNLPRNDLISRSIICFIYDIPYICSVQRVDCSPQDFLCVLSHTDPIAAQEIATSEAYLSLVQTQRRCRIQAIWLPQNTVLFQPLIADPRQVTNSAALRFNDNVVGKHVGAVSFGDEFILIRLLDVLWWHGDMDLGVEAGFFSVFDLGPCQSLHV